MLVGFQVSPTFVVIGLRRRGDRFRKRYAVAPASSPPKALEVGRIERSSTESGTGDIFFAESDRDWVIEGASVHISMVGFDDGTEPKKHLDGRQVQAIHANLSSTSDISRVHRLSANSGIAFIGTTKKAPFDIPLKVAMRMLLQPNPHGRPNSEVIHPYANGLSVTRRPWTSGSLISERKAKNKLLCTKHHFSLYLKLSINFVLSTGSPDRRKSGGCWPDFLLRRLERHPACRRREARPGFHTERENLAGDAKGKGTSGSNSEAESTDAPERGGLPRSSGEGPVMGLERRGQVIDVGFGPTGNRRSLTTNGRRQPSIDGTSRMMREYQVPICEGCALQAREIQSPEMAAAAKPNQQPCTKSCVVSGNGHCEA